MNKKLKTYLSKRFYLRGLTPLGLFNTILGAVFNRVIVKKLKGGKLVGLYIDKATKHPRKK